MKKHFILICCIISAYVRAGNLPCESTFLSNNMNTMVELDNSFNFESGIEIPPYGNYSGPDTWLSFLAPSSGNVEILFQGETMENAAIAIYQGSCDNLKLLYNVVDNNCDDTNFPALHMTELEPNEEYFIRVWAQLGSSNGSFNILIAEEIELEAQKFLVYADATHLEGNCISLTEDERNFNGCAWYETPIDFSQPFTHNMTANFGNLDSDGADGICLIYQANGPDFCGESGGGIGALGMPLSLIVEFDTWHNGIYNDPLDDHIAVNTNGNMNHFFSIAGPIALPNIEDGNDHNITFSWDPNDNSFKIYFDNILRIDDNYDFINFAFGGQTNVWWGYTAGTGDYYNNHIICPVIPAFEGGTQEYLEMTICEGETYSGFSESGFYIYQEEIDSLCTHQVNLLLEVITNEEPTEIFETICKNDTFTYNGIPYWQEGIYPYTHTNINGCDSLITINLNIFDHIVELPPDTLTCSNDSLLLTPSLQYNIPVDSMTFLWETPYDSIFHNDSLIITHSGTYILNTQFILSQDTYCLSSDTAFIVQDTFIPSIAALEDISWNCSDSIAVIAVSPDSLSDVFQYEWFLNDNLLTNTTELHAVDSGEYILLVSNQMNGCLYQDTFQITKTEELPQVVISSDILDCNTHEISIGVTPVESDYSYVWFHDGAFFSNDMEPQVDQIGTYTLEVTSQDGCISIFEEEIIEDLEYPIVNVLFDSITCLNPEISISTQILNDFDYIEWLLPDGSSLIGNNINSDQEGIYYYTIYSDNGCNTLGSVDILAFDEYPTLSVHTPDTLTCEVTEVSLSASSNMDVIYHWSDSQGNTFNIDNITSNQPGIYTVTVIDQYGCQKDTFVEVFQNIEYPQLSLSGNDINCFTDFSSIEISTNDTLEQLNWNGPNNFSSQNHNISVIDTGMYTVTYMNELGCWNSDSISITSNIIYPIVELSSDSINCSSLSANVLVNTSDNLIQTNWTGPNGFTSTSQNINIISPGIYVLISQNQYGCQDTSQIEILDITEYPEIKLLTASIIEFEAGENHQINTEIIFDQSEIVSIEWHPMVNLSCYNCPNPIFTGNNQDNIIYTMTVINDQGCESMIEIQTLEITVPEIINIIGPNIISANNDNINDRFTLYGSPLELIDRILTLNIYDRWGGLVFFTEDIPIGQPSFGWDGTFNGKNVEQSVFAYYAQVLLTSGEVRVLKGDVAVIR